MTKLGVNIDHVATVRQARMVKEPDPVQAAVLAELAGAHGITVHLREDRRHIQDRDLEVLRRTVKTKLNLEMACVDEIIKIACQVKPDMVTFVPEKRKELTTEGGLDVILNKTRLKKAVLALHKNGIQVSMFIDPDEDHIKVSKIIGADFVELHTGKYAEAKSEKSRDNQFKKLQRASDIVLKAGLGLNAGHGLDYMNVGPIARIPGMNELNIGHSIVARAVLVGMNDAVSEMLALIRNSDNRP